MIPPSKVRLEDDFLGDELSSQYRTSLVGNGQIKLVTYDNFGRGLLQLSCWGIASVARMHHGGVLSNDGVDFRNWMMRANIDFGARFFINSNTSLQVTIGFTGTNDPDNVLAPYLNTDVSPHWQFQAHRKVNGTLYSQQVDSGFIHTPGEFTTFEIGIDPDTSEPIFKANGNEVARITNLDAVPTTAMVPEWQLWNVPVGGGAFSSPTMWLEWWGAQQDR